MIWYPSKKETDHQFYVGYMTHPFLKKLRIHRDQVIKMFQSAFKLVTIKCIKNESSKKNVSILSFTMFYNNSVEEHRSLGGSIIIRLDNGAFVGLIYELLVFS